MDQADTQSNMYQQLINQNHAGDVPNAVVEEEVIYDDGHLKESPEQAQMMGTQMPPSSAPHVNNQSPANQQIQQQQLTQVQSRAPPQTALQKQQAHQQLQQKLYQQHLQKQQQQQQRQQQQQQNQLPVGKPITVVKSQPRVMVHTSKSPNQHFPGATTQLSQAHVQKQQLLQQHLQQQQQQKVSYQQNYQGKPGLPAQNMNNSNKPMSSEEAKINQQLLLQEKQIAENNRRLEAFGMSPVIVTGADGTPQQNASNGGVKQQLTNAEYRAPGAKSPETSDVRQLLLLSNTQTVSKKVDVKIEDSNGSHLTGGAAQSQGQLAVSQLTSSSPRQHKTVIPGQGQNMSKIVHSPVGGTQVQIAGVNPTVNQIPVQVSSVSSNQSQAVSGQGMPTIHRNNVVLEGGGQFEEGQAYVIRDKHGHSRTMIWSRGEFKPYAAQPENTNIQNSTIDSSQRGRGSRGRRGGSGRGRGRGRGQGNTGDATFSPRIRPANNIRPNNHFVRSPVPNSPRVLVQGQAPGTIVLQAGRPRAPQIHTLQVGPGPGLTKVLQNLMPPAQGLHQRPTGPHLARPPLHPEKEGANAVTDSEGGAECQPGDPAESANSVDKPNIPTDPKTVAVCQFCGYTGDNKEKCESCKRTFTSATKYIIKTSSVEASDPKRRKLEGAMGDERTSLIDKKIFFGKQREEQNLIYSQILNPVNSATPHSRLLTRGVTVRKYRGRGRGRGIIVPETVTISSDEEDGGSSGDHAAKVHKMVAPVTTPVPATSKSPSHSEHSDCPESPLIPTIPISSRLDSKSRVSKMEDEKGSSRPTRERSLSPVAHAEITLKARVVRVGTFRGAPVEPILMSKSGINFFIEARNDTHRFHIYPQEIQQCLARFDDNKACYVFLLTSQSCGIRTRTDLNMATRTGPNQPMPEPYFDPHSTDMTHQMITIIMEQVDIPTRGAFQKHMDSYKSYGKQADEGFYMELSADETDEILKQSTKKMVQPHTIVTVMHPSAMAAAPDHMYSHQMEEDRQSASPSPPRIGFVGPIIRLLTYPRPPAKGGISITNEDLYCLQEGEFLNDVIIDFYLKYLLLEKLSEEDRARTHIFSSFFYKRLTQRIRGASLDDDPTVTLPVKRHARVKTWTRHVDLFKKDFIVIPINEHAHWFLAIICFPGLEESQENVYIPKPLTTPLVDPVNCPTPPQPTEVTTEEDMETDEPENPVPVKKEPEKAPETTEAATNPPVATEPSKPAADSEVDKEKLNGATQGEVPTSSQSDPQPEQVPTSTETSQEEEGKPEGKPAGEAEAVTGTSEADAQTDTKPEVTPTPVTPVSYKVIRGKPIGENEEKPEDAVTGLKQPCILIFDSLSGPSRSRIVQVLKEYLQVEWQVKKGGTELNKSAFKGCVAKVPQQNNFSDCGVFMLQYVESFFGDPIQDFTTPVRGLHDWFSGPLIDGKREELRDLIIGLKEKYESQEGAKDNT